MDRTTTSQTMHCVEISQPGGPDVLNVVQRDRPTPATGEVLIEVHAAGVNRPDALQRAGLYRAPPQACDLPGLEVAGEIIAGDAAAAGFSIGDKVCALAPGGGYSEYCVVPAAHCLPIPTGLNMQQSAALPETCFTVWSNVFDRGALAQGESLLVHGGSSGIGTTAIQIATALGHPVFTTVGSDVKRQACEQLGAQVIHYKNEDFAARILEATQQAGVNVILDMVAGDYTARNIRCLADDGRIVIIGLLGGAKAEIPLAQVLLRRLSITGSTLRPHSDGYKTKLAIALRQQVWPLIVAGQFKPVIDQVFPMAQAHKAHERMESGQHIGKIVLQIKD